jgi:Flp pilus assembly pilin Flp
VGQNSHVIYFGKDEEMKKIIETVKKMDARIVDAQMKVLQTDQLEAGEVSLEWAMIAGIIIAVVLGSFMGLGGAIAGVFERAAGALGG